MRVDGASDSGTLFAPNEILVRASTVVNSISSRKRGVERNSGVVFPSDDDQTAVDDRPQAARATTALSPRAIFGLQTSTVTCARSPEKVPVQPSGTFPVGCNFTVTSAAAMSEIAVQSGRQIS